MELLGSFPQKPDLRLDTLESVRLDSGWRYKLKYLAESADTTFHFPEDWVYAYLFVPDHEEGAKLPAIVAIHQDDIYYHIGKDEPAGLQGDSTMFYGLDLYNRGYVVICPDRYYHAERRMFDKIPWDDFTEPDYQRDYNLFANRVGMLMLRGMSHYAKEAYDQSIAVDVLYTMNCVNKDRIGAIGHSAGGVAMAHFMFYDTRVALGVSSCGVYNVKRVFDYETPVAFPANMSFPNLIKEGYTTNDYVRHIYPRSLLITRGMYEWGKGDEGSVAFIDEAYDFEKSYKKAGNDGDIKIVVFDENGGGHIFPKGVKKEVYQWIDERLKR